MKLSVMTGAFHGRLLKGTLSPETLVAKLKDAGATAIEVMYVLKQRNHGCFQALVDAAFAAGLRISCYDIGIDLVGDDATREQRLEEARQEIAYAGIALNAPTVMLYNADVVPGMSFDGGRKIYARSLCALARFARPYGIKITIEDFDLTPDFACSSKDCLDILNMAGPDVALNFDTGNFFAVGEISTQVFARVRHRIAHCHVKDVFFPDDSPEHKMRMCAIGSGIADIPGCIRLLKSVGYQKYLSVEIAGNQEDDAVKALQFLRAAIDN